MTSLNSRSTMLSGSQQSGSFSTRTGIRSMRGLDPAASHQHASGSSGPVAIHITQEVDIDGEPAEDKRHQVRLCYVNKYYRLSINSLCAGLGYRTGRSALITRDLEKGFNFEICRSRYTVMARVSWLAALWLKALWCFIIKSVLAVCGMTCDSLKDGH